MTSTQLDSSFRDDAGALFTHQGTLYRGITQVGLPDYQQLMASGCYQALVDKGLLVPHEEVTLAGADQRFVKIIKPERLPFISYPYEWSFGQFKRAALHTLEVQKVALEHDLSLKDASFFNIQFIGPHSIFIDTLSFEKRTDTPWVAYRQFCQHFLGPLLIMSRRDASFAKQLVSFLDGVPLSQIVAWLPQRLKFSLNALMHIYWHAKSQKRYESTREEKPVVKKQWQTFSKQRQLALIDNLTSFVSRLQLPKVKTEWADYTDELDHYSKQADAFKKQWVSQTITRVIPQIVWDLGGNIGEYSRLATAQGIKTICFDIDHQCVEKNYQLSLQKKDRLMLPLVQDLGNPTPSIGWGHAERLSLLDRAPADLVLALAVIHHLRITANIPLVKIADFMRAAGKKLVIEFVPKADVKVKALLKNRRDIFSDYTQEQFEKIFQARFTHMTKISVPETERTLYLFETT